MKKTSLILIIFFLLFSQTIATPFDLTDALDKVDKNEKLSSSGKEKAKERIYNEWILDWLNKERTKAKNKSKNRNKIWKSILEDNYNDALLAVKEAKHIDFIERKRIKRIINLMKIKDIAQPKDKIEALELKINNLELQLLNLEQDLERVKEDVLMEDLNTDKKISFIRIRLMKLKDKLEIPY